MFALATSAWIALPVLRSGGTSLGLILLLAGLYTAVDMSNVAVEVRRQVWIIGLGELPLVLGLFLGDPRDLLLARLLAAAIAYWPRRTSVLKKSFNTVLFTIDIAVACLVFAAVGVDTDATQPVNWLAALLAAVTSNAVGALAVWGVISVTQGRPSREQSVMALLSQVMVAPIGAVLSLIILLLRSVDTRAVSLMVVVFAVVAVGYRAYARVLRQHHSLGTVYRFSRDLEKARTDDAALRDGVDQVRDLLNATVAVLRIEGAPATLVVSTDEGRPYVADGSDAIIRRAMGGSVRLSVRNATDGERAALDRRSAEEVLVVPFRIAGDRTGYLELRDRQGDRSSFTADDLSLLENLTTHFAANVENQGLVDQLRHEAYHDRLTGLPNREQFTQAVDRAIAEVRGKGGLVAVLLLDLNSFKDVNDALGHDYGDELLIMVGRRLRQHAGEGATVARMGADEFAVLSPVADLDDAVARAERLCEALALSYSLAGLTVEVGVSIGVTVAPDHAHNGGMLMQRADVALYHAKDSGRAVSSYLPSMDQASVHRLRLVTQLREAINAGQVQVAYQPKIGLDTKSLVGVEALVRWQHPEHGLVMPDQFVPLAERTGLIGPLTRHVLRTSLIQCRDWLDRDMRIGVAVNLSVRNLLDTNFPDIVVGMLQELNVPPELLTFEITESSVMKDPDRCLPVLHRMHELGISMSIDDFGTGYSSLAYLRRLPVDEVKIDKVFVLGMGTDLSDMAIVRAIVELGRSLSLRVVAEGVENELARELLAGMGCDVAQGYMISRALAPDKLDAWLQARTSLGPAQPGVRGRRPQMTG